MLTPLDDYPIHQTALPIAHPASGARVSGVLEPSSSEPAFDEVRTLMREMRDEMRELRDSLEELRREVRALTRPEIR